MGPIIYSVLTEVDYRLPLYLASIGAWTNQPEVVRKEGFRAFQWIQCLEGQGKLEIAGKTMTVAKGQGMLLFPEIPHRYWPVIEPWTVRWVEFSGQFAVEHIRSLLFTESTVLHVTNPGPLLARMDEIAAVIQNKTSISSYESSQHLYGLLIDLFRYTSKSDYRSTLQQQYEHLSPVLQYIEGHNHEQISLQDLADQIGVTPTHLCVLFRQALGVRPFEYVNGHRIRKAKELLLQPEALEIQRISERVGFANPSYFNKIFKKYEGITPNAFRKLHYSM